MYVYIYICIYYTHTHTHTRTHIYTCQKIRGLIAWGDHFERLRPLAPSTFFPFRRRTNTGTPLCCIQQQREAACTSSLRPDTLVALAAARIRVLPYVISYLFILYLFIYAYTYIIYLIYIHLLYSIHARIYELQYVYTYVYVYTYYIYNIYVYIYYIYRHAKGMLQQIQPDARVR